VLEVSPGEVAGIKSATVEIQGPYAYGHLKAEQGVHRLVRISPLRVLKARLAELKRREREEELRKLKGEQRSIEWGSQIRSYVLHPYRLVKDHRTGVEVGDVDAVLAGELDAFIEAYLRRPDGS